MKKWTKKTVALSLVAIAVIGGGSAYAYSSSQSKQKLEAAQTEVKNQEATLKTLNNDLKGYFDKKSPSYLVENMQESQIKDLKKDVEKATSLKETSIKVDRSAFDKEVGAVNTTMTKLEKTFEQQQSVNKLFQGTAVNGAKISKDLPIADDLKQEKIDQVKKSVEKPTSEFEKTIQSLAIEAENQVTQIDKAKEATAKVYKDKVVSTDTKLYDTAKAETEKIKNTKAKKALNDQLAKVKADIDKKAVEAEKKETKVKEATAADQSQQQQNTVTAADTQAVTDQGAAAPDYSGAGGNTDAGYAPQGNVDPGYQQPQYQAPAQDPTPQAPATGGGQSQPTPPASSGVGSGSNVIVVNPEDVQGTGDNQNSGGSNWWAGFE